MVKDGKVFHAKKADHDGYIGVYIGNDRNAPLYRFPGGVCHSFDADHRFAEVPGQEWVEEFFR